MYYSIEIICCNISSSSTATSQKHLLQRPKNPNTTFENHLLQRKKNPLQHGKNSKKTYKTTPGASSSSSLEGGGNRISELTRTLATATSLRSRGGGGGRLRSREGGGALRSRGGGFRSREGPTYLVRAAAVVLVSCGGSGSRVAGERGVA
jgi:hypothetical protein